MLKSAIAGLLICLHAATAWSFADEERDWGVALTPEIRQPPYSAPTPLGLPGARVILTRDLQAMLATDKPPILIDVASGDGHVTLQGAYWLPGAGRGSHFIDSLQAQLAHKKQNLRDCIFRLLLALE